MKPTKKTVKIKVEAKGSLGLIRLRESVRAKNTSLGISELLPKLSVVEIIKKDAKSISVKNILEEILVIPADTEYEVVSSKKSIISADTIYPVEVTGATSDNTNRSMVNRSVQKAMVLTSNAIVEDDPVKLAKYSISASLLAMSVAQDSATMMLRIQSLANKLISNT